MQNRVGQVATNEKKNEKKINEKPNEKNVNSVKDVLLIELVKHQHSTYFLDAEPVCTVARCN